MAPQDVNSKVLVSVRKGIDKSRNYDSVSQVAQGEYQAGTVL